MNTYEFEGKTTEEAIENASRQLDLPLDELGIEIIEPGSAGIFGLVGTKKAKIKVTVKIEPEADKLDKPNKVHEADELDKPDKVHEADKVDKVDEVDEVDEEEGVKLAQETLENILALIPVDTTVDTGRVDGNIALKIEGDKSGLLIGRKGKTLDALQHIVNKIVNKSLDKKMRVTVDSEDYRERRKESLKQLALKMGEKAKKTRKPVTINPLIPRDRRIIHLALKDDEGLETKSRGDGLLKKILVIPKR
ncbi:RNA-binding cell elongation regulator Jag/EloR [Thermodesulfobacteriota bacterium]